MNIVNLCLWHVLDQTVPTTVRHDGHPTLINMVSYIVVTCDEMLRMLEDNQKKNSVQHMTEEEHLT